MLSSFETFTANLIEIINLKGDMLGKVDFQKTIYLCKQLGVFIPFEFRWNKIGPYSFELAHFVNHLTARNLLSVRSGRYSVNFENPFAGQVRSLSSINQTSISRLDRLFKSIRRKVRQKGYSIPLFMECLGSIHFIKISLETTSKRRVFDTLRKLKPYRARDFSRMAEDAWQLLIQNGL